MRLNIPSWATQSQLALGEFLSKVVTRPHLHTSSQGSSNWGRLFHISIFPYCCPSSSRNRSRLILSATGLNCWLHSCWKPPPPPHPMRSDFCRMTWFRLEGSMSRECKTPCSFAHPQCRDIAPLRLGSWVSCEGPAPGSTGPSSADDSIWKSCLSFFKWGSRDRSPGVTASGELSWALQEGGGLPHLTCQTTSSRGCHWHNLFVLRWITMSWALWSGWIPCSNAGGRAMPPKIPSTLT